MTKKHRLLLQKSLLYAVTNLKIKDDSIIEKIDSAYRGGVDIVQLRSKVLTDSELIRLGLKIKKISARHGKIFIVNDRIDIAAACHADGVHLGQDDLSIKTAKTILRRIDENILVGKSTHCVRQAIEAEKEGSDYIGVGPVFSTPTKPSVLPVGLRFIKDVTPQIEIPYFAIGGIDENNLNDVLSAGASRVAVVRAIFDKRNPGKSAKKIKEILSNKTKGLRNVKNS